MKSLRNASESNFRFGRWSMSVGGVLRIGSSVGAMVAVFASAGVIVGDGAAVTVDMDIAVQTTVGMGDGVSVICSTIGSGATCATGTQAFKNKNVMIKTIAMRFMGFFPLMNCILI